MRDFQLLKKVTRNAAGESIVVVDKFSALPEQRDINGQTNRTWVSGQVETVKIDRNKLLKGLKLRLTVDLTTGVTPGTPTARENNPTELLKNLTVKINGKPVIGPMSGRLAFLLAQYLRGKEALEITKFTTASLQTSSQTLQAIAEIPLDFSLPGIAEPLAHAGAVYAPVCNDIEVSWQWGTTSDLMDSPGATQTIAATTKVEVTYAYAEPDRRFVDREGYGLFTRNGTVAKTDFGTGEYTYLFNSGALYRCVAMLVSGGSTKRVSDAVFTGNLRVDVDGTPIFGDSAAAVVAAVNRNLPTSFDRTGFYVLDPLKGGGSGDVLPSLEKMWRVPQLRNLRLKGDTTALSSGQIEFCPFVYLPKPEALGLMGAGVAG